MACAEDGDYLLVAAIDFGTTFSGYAFSFKGTKEDPEMSEKIRTNKNWGAALGFQSYKTATSVLTDREGRFLDFGFDAELKYGESMEEGDEEPDMLLFRHFKMMLHKHENVKLTSVISAEDGTLKPALSIFSYALKYLMEHMLDAIKLESGRKPDKSLIRWVITVPAIWSEESKQFMRKAAAEAGLIESKDSRKLIIALEPEAASLCCRRLNIAQYSNAEGISFKAGTKYLVLDCGGGTADITAHEIQFDKKVKELLRASGGGWGGTEVDRKFLQLMESMFGKHFMNAYRQKYSHEFLQFVTNFERTKKAFKPDGQSKLSLSIPYSLGIFYSEQHRGKRIEKAIKDASVKDVSFGNGLLVIKHDAAYKLFEPVVQSISGHVNKLLKDRKLKGIKYILMVGGFSESQVLQQIIKSNFAQNGVKVLVPAETQLAIIKGAVLFGHNPDEIGTRIAQMTYGISIKQPFDPAVHEESRKIYVEGKEYCDKIFSPLVLKGQEVKIQETIESSYHVQKSCDKVIFSIYATNDAVQKPKHYTDDHEHPLQLLGNVTLGNLGTETRKDFILTLKFGGTEMQVDVLHKEGNKQQSTIVDFLTKP